MGEEKRMCRSACECWVELVSQMSILALVFSYTGAVCLHASCCPWAKYSALVQTPSHLTLGAHSRGAVSPLQVNDGPPLPKAASAAKHGKH